MRPCRGVTPDCGHGDSDGARELATLNVPFPDPSLRAKGCGPAGGGLDDRGRLIGLLGPLDNCGVGRDGVGMGVRLRSLR
jgi:hypothetical protein